jgi:hypothetical protein
VSFNATKEKNNNKSDGCWWDLRSASIFANPAADESCQCTLEDIIITSSPSFLSCSGVHRGRPNDTKAQNTEAGQK